jgi:hypothetical protein
MGAFEHMGWCKYLSINESFNVARISEIELLTAAGKVASIK